MHIIRYIGDNGELLRYEIKKEMTTRGARYYKTAKRREYIKDALYLAPGVILLLYIAIHFIISII